MGRLFPDSAGSISGEEGGPPRDCATQDQKRWISIRQGRDHHCGFIGHALHVGGSYPNGFSYSSQGQQSPDRPSTAQRLMLVQCLSAVSLPHGDLSLSPAAIVSSMPMAWRWRTCTDNHRMPSPSRTSGLTDDEAEKIARLIVRLAKRSRRSGYRHLHRSS